MKKFNTQHLLKAAILVLFLFTATIFAQETALQFNTDDANTKDEFIICTSGNYSPIFTIEAWVKLDSLITGDQTFLHSYHIQMKKNSDGYVEVYDHGNGLSAGISTTKLEVEKWMQSLIQA